MEKDKIIIITALLLGFFVLWFVFYSSGPTVEEPREEDKKENDKDSTPWRRETRDLGNDYEYDFESEFNNDFDNDFDNDFETDYDPEDYDIDFELDFEDLEAEDTSQDIDKQDYDEPQISDSIQKKVDDCLASENQRYQDILNIYLNEDSLFYVGDDNYLEYQRQYQEDHERRKRECYQLYLD